MKKVFFFKINYISIILNIYFYIIIKLIIKILNKK